MPKVLGPPILFCSEGMCRNKTPWCDVSFDRYSGSFQRLRGLLFVRHRVEWADLLVLGECMISGQGLYRYFN